MLHLRKEGKPAAQGRLSKANTPDDGEVCHVHQSISIRTDEETLADIDCLDAHQDRSRSQWINRVINYAQTWDDVWEVNIKEGIAAADRGIWFRV